MRATEKLNVASLSIHDRRRLRVCKKPKKWKRNDDIRKWKRNDDIRPSDPDHTNSCLYQMSKSIDTVCCQDQNQQVDGLNRFKECDSMHMIPLGEKLSIAHLHNHQCHYFSPESSSMSHRYHPNQAQYQTVQFMDTYSLLPSQPTDNVSVSLSNSYYETPTIHTNRCYHSHSYYLSTMTPSITTFVTSSRKNQPSQSLFTNFDGFRIPLSN
jgi:hypothetical protein